MIERTLQDLVNNHILLGQTNPLFLEPRKIMWGQHTGLRELARLGKQFPCLFPLLMTTL